MIALDVRIHVDGQGCWPELRNNFITGKLVGVARLTNGTAHGKSTVTIRVELPGGQTVLAETTTALLSNALRAFTVADEAGIR